MKRPSLLAGIAFAFAATIFAVPIWWVLKTALPFSWAFRVGLVVPYLAYCTYLILAARARIGTITLSVANLAIGALLFTLPISNTILACSFAGLLTLNRSLRFHRSLVSVCCDGIVSGTGLIFAGYLFSATGNFPAGVWGFLLVQSVFAMIPSQFSEKDLRFSSSEKGEVDPFQRSRRQAHEALKRLVEEGGV